MAKLKVGVLISGRGSNLRSLIAACDDSDFPAEIALVISNRETAPGLQYAHDAGIAVQVIPRKQFDSRDACDAAMTKALHTRNVGIKTSPHTITNGQRLKATVPWIAMTITEPSSAARRMAPPTATLATAFPRSSAALRTGAAF